MIYSNMMNNASKYTRDGVLKTAGWMEAGVAPLNLVLKAAIGLSDIAHGSVNKLLEQQHAVLVGTVEAGAKRFKVAADSQGIRDLVQDQVALLPESRARISKDLKQTWEILAETQSELRSTFSPSGKRTAKTAKTAKKKTPKAATTPTVEKAAK